jgi:hypothetical protein
MAAMAAALIIVGSFLFGFSHPIFGTHACHVSSCPLAILVVPARENFGVLLL